MYDPEQDAIAQAIRAFGTADERYILDRILNSEVLDVFGYEVEDEDED